MRTIDPAAAAVVGGVSVLLVEMLLTTPTRMCSATQAITYGGNEYLAIGHLGAVETIDDSPGEIKSMRFILNGVSNDLLAVALAEPIRGKAVYMRLAILDPDTHAVLDAPLIWSGTLDQMPIQMGKESSVISVTAEHRGATYARPKPLRYADGDQQRLHPGDTSLRFTTSQANHQDVWPAAAFFRQ